MVVAICSMAVIRVERLSAQEYVDDGHEKRGHSDLLEGHNVLQRYGNPTYLICRECGRKIFVESTELVVRNGKSYVVVTCPQPGCAVYKQNREYAAVELEIGTYGSLECGSPPRVQSSSRR